MKAMNSHANATQMMPTTDQDSPPEVLGFSLNLAIETLSEIDKLAKSFLHQLGVESIDPSLFYPYHYRLNFFQEIDDRFGWPGLFMLGAKIPERVTQVLEMKGTPSTYLLVIQPYADQLNELIDFQDLNKSRQALEKMVVLHNQQLSLDAQRGLRGRDAVYEWFHIEEPAADGEIARFLLTNISLSPVDFEAALRANCLYCFRKIFPEGVDFSFEHVPALSKIEGPHHHCSFRLVFKPMAKDVTHAILWSEQLEVVQKQLYKNALNFAFDQEKLVKDKVQKIEELMLNVLPKKIAARLESGEKTISDGCPNATILFSDIVGFTAMSFSKSAEELVYLLNDLFTSFDQRALTLGIEKIKTIGDAYMVAGGLEGGGQEDAVKVIEMAMGMYDDLAVFNQRHKMTLGMRIGINSGPVVAGVIGHSKFAYDLWGNTVNTASRMESTSIPGKIQISPSTYAQVKDCFEIQERELIECKGIGQIMTYFVEGPLPKN
jgi:class 3 adenylate cyclase